MSTTDDTDEYYTSTVVGGRLDADSGGTLELDPTKPMEAPGGLQATEYGTQFGPLEIAAYPGSTARVGGLSFDTPARLFEGLFGTGSGDGLFAGGLLLAGADPDGDDNDVTRRDLLRAAAASGMLLGGTATTVSAAGSTKTLTRAQYAVLENPSGIRMRVFDRVPNVLPPDTLYYTYVDGQDYASFSAANESDYGDVLPKTVGTVTVGPKGSGGGFFAALGTDKTQTYQGLALSKPTGEADTGEELTITTNDIIVEHVQSAGSDRTTLSIAGTSIPHEHESASSPKGYYGIHNGSLIYRVGSNAPSGQTADLVLYADRVTELLDDIDREVS